MPSSFITSYCSLSGKVAALHLKPEHFWRNLGTEIGNLMDMKWESTIRTMDQHKVRGNLKFCSTMSCQGGDLLELVLESLRPYLVSVMYSAAFYNPAREESSVDIIESRGKCCGRDGGCSGAARVLHCT